MTESITLNQLINLVLTILVVIVSLTLVLRHKKSAERFQALQKNEKYLDVCKLKCQQSLEQCKASGNPSCEWMNNYCVENCNWSSNFAKP